MEAIWWLVPSLFINQSLFSKFSRRENEIQREKCIKSEKAALSVLDSDEEPDPTIRQAAKPTSSQAKKFLENATGEDCKWSAFDAKTSEDVSKGDTERCQDDR